MKHSVAGEVARIVQAVMGPLSGVQITGWDGSSVGEPDAAVGITIHSPRALRRRLWSPNELGLGRAYVAGEVELSGSIFDFLALRDQIGRADSQDMVDLASVRWLGLIGPARRLGALGLPPQPPPEEARLRGRQHTKRRDAAAISHHYDIGNDFYRLLLGSTMTYSCGYFPEPNTTLDQAQEGKYELICRKLGLRPGMRLLDVGCGWGGMLRHAATHHGVTAVGVTISAEQAGFARQRIAADGLSDRIEVRLQDYRDIDDGPYDAISSIGMFEHVGLQQLTVYLRGLRELLRPGGRLLNHAISRPGESGLDPDSFVARYVFPDGQLHEVGRVISSLQDQGLECRDVESLREHYVRTLRHWIANLERNWGRAVAVAGEPRARIWRLYLAGAAHGFEANRITSTRSWSPGQPQPATAACPPPGRRF